jgi:hypothetical protein
MIKSDGGRPAELIDTKVDMNPVGGECHGGPLTHHSHSRYPLDSVSLGQLPSLLHHMPQIHHHVKDNGPTYLPFSINRLLPSEVGSNPKSIESKYDLNLMQPYGYGAPNSMTADYYNQALYHHIPTNSS